MNETRNFKRYVLTVELDAATPEQDSLLLDFLRNMASGFYEVARRGHADNMVHVHLDLEEPVMQAGCGGSGIKDFIASQRKAKESDDFDNWFKGALGNNKQ